MHLSKFDFIQSASFWHRFVMTLIHLVRHTSWKNWPMRLNSNGPSSFCISNSWVKIFDLKSGSVYARKYSASNQACQGATWLVISSAPFLKEILIWLGYFRPSLISLSVMLSAPKDAQQVYQLNWGMFWALTRYDIVTIFTLLSCVMRWSRLCIY